MKTEVECLTPNDPVRDAAQCMRDENIGFLPVCGENREILGTVTDRDIAIRVVAEGLSGGEPIDKIMSRDVVSCLSGDDVERAQQLMAEHKKSRIMCVDDRNRLVGVISLSDIAQHQSGARLSETLRDVSSREVRT
jgi:CBS domain-containing protein